MRIAELPWDHPNVFQIPVVVTAQHIDSYGHVNNVVYIQWLTDCAWAHSAAVGLPEETCVAMGRGMAVRSLHIDLLAAAYEADELLVGDWVSSNDRRLRATRLFQILNPPLIVAAALLHDITKTQSLKTKENHAETGANLLEEMGYPQVAEVVRGHVRLSAGTGLSPMREVHIVNYADKRVRHATVVSLEERFVDLVERYGQTQERRLRIEQMRKTTLELEQQMFRRMDTNPGVLQSFNDLSPFYLIEN